MLVDSGGLRVHGVVLVHKVLVIRVSSVFYRHAYFTSLIQTDDSVCVLHILLFTKKLLAFNSMLTSMKCG